MKTALRLTLPVLLITVWAVGCVVPTESYEASSAEVIGENGIVLDNGLNLPNGFRLANGIQLANGIRLSNGVQVTNGILAPNGIRLSNGIRLANGIRLSNGVVLTGTIDGPFIAPAAGSDLERWLDADPTNNVRILKYMIQCALGPAKTVVLQYRGVQQRIPGLMALGPSWTAGEMTVADQESVSACLLARVNARGAVITINLGGPFAGLDTRSAAEIADYPWMESVFYGNIFLDTPDANACSASTFRSCLSRLCLRADGSCDCGVLDIPSELPRCPHGGYGAGSCIQPVPGGAYESCSMYEATGVRVYSHPVTAWTAQAPNGEPCTTAAGCITGVCQAGVCGEAVGSSCATGSECSTDSCAESICGGPGAVCFTSADCRYQNCSRLFECGGARSGTYAGSSCSAAYQCRTHLCTSGECRRCTRSRDCGGLTCNTDTGVCQ